MVSLKIGNEERRNGDIKERWIAQQLRKRNDNVCIELIIRESDVNARFQSGACSSPVSGGSKPNRKESQLFKLWDQKGLNGTGVNAGMVISFLNQYDKYI